MKINPERFVKAAKAQVQEWNAKNGIQPVAGSPRCMMVSSRNLLTSQSWLPRHFDLGGQIKAIEEMARKYRAEWAKFAEVVQVIAEIGHLNSNKHFNTCKLHKAVRNFAKQAYEKAKEVEELRGSDPLYPFSYAARIVGANAIDKMAKALGMEPREIAEKIADQYLDDAEADAEAEALEAVSKK